MPARTPDPRVRVAPCSLLTCTSMLRSARPWPRQQTRPVTRASSWLSSWPVRGGAPRPGTVCCRWTIPGSPLRSQSSGIVAATSSCPPVLSNAVDHGLDAQVAQAATHRRPAGAARHRSGGRQTCWTCLRPPVTRLAGLFDSRTGRATRQKPQRWVVSGEWPSWRYYRRLSRRRPWRRPARERVAPHAQHAPWPAGCRP